MGGKKLTKALDINFRVSWVELLPGLFRRAKAQLRTPVTVSDLSWDGAVGQGLDRGRGHGRTHILGRLGITAPYREAPLLFAGVAGDLAAAVFGEAADQFAAQGGHFDFDARVGGVAGRGGGFVGAEANG